MNLKNRENSLKLADLNYSKLEMQEYLKLNTMTKEAAQTVFKNRVRMANYGKTSLEVMGQSTALYVAPTWMVRKLVLKTDLLSIRGSL